MGKEAIIQEITSSLIDQHLLVSYNPKADIYVDMFFECVNTKVGSRRIQCQLIAHVNETTKTIIYYHHFEERTMGYSVYSKGIEENDRVKEEVFTKDFAGNKNTFTLDSDEIIYLFQSIAQEFNYKFRRVNDRKQVVFTEPLSKEKRRTPKEELRSFPLWQWGLVLLVMVAFNLFFKIELFGWTISVATAMIMLIATRIFDQYLLYFLSLWVLIQMALWFLY